jgi:mono/diheme cytochrome c family protein
MRPIIHLLLGALIVFAAIAVAGLLYARITGLRGQPQPGRVETRLARSVRSLAIPAALKRRSNPEAGSSEASSRGLEHFAKYCAVCHGNDGDATDSAFGSGLYPKPPDLRGALTQELSDGELFYVIENGVRFSGMPAFGSGKSDPAGEKQTWDLVTFVRHLPRLTPDELSYMQSLNPL